MTRRRPIYRKQQERPASRKGLLLSLLLAGAVVLVPIGGGFMSVAKTKLRDLALTTGFIQLDDCVITASRSLACTSGAVGTPVPVALRQMGEFEAKAAEEALRREEADATVRKLVAEVDRLNADLEQSRLAVQSAGFLPPVVTTVTRSGTTDPASSTLPAETEIYEPAGE